MHVRHESLITTFIRLLQINRTKPPFLLSFTPSTNMENALLTDLQLDFTCHLNDIIYVKEYVRSTYDFVPILTRSR